MKNFYPLIKPLSIATLAMGSFWISTAYASSDWDCGSNFSLDNRRYNECHVNFPTLDTGNDTQTNLYLLLADKGFISFVPTKKAEVTRYSYDFPLTLDDLEETAVNQVKNPKQTFLQANEKNTEAEYCNSFNTGSDALQKALKLDPKLTATERQQLLAFRESIKNNCQSSDEDKTVVKPKANLPSKWSANAQPYADYIVATQMFYTGDKTSFDSADSLYRALSQLKPNNNDGLNWLADTANYMLIRTGINRVYQSGMGEYSYDIAKADAALIAGTQKAIDNYINHGKGRYLPSARGLQRRLYWLSGQQDKLISEMEWQLNHPNSPLFNLDSRVLPAEIERKIFFTDMDHPLDINKLHDPTLITSFALSRLRPAVEGEPKPLTLTELEALKPKFSSHPSLYQYLLANYYWVQQNNSKQALQYLPTDSPKGKLSYFSLSQYALKARLLEAMGQKAEAISLWQALHQLPKQPYQSTITELALTLEADRTNNYNQLFGPNATIHSPDLKMQVIQHSADAKLLTQIADTYSATDPIGAEARYALLTKSLLHGQYADFLRYKTQYLPKNAQDYLGYDSKNEALKNLPEFSQFNWKGTKISPAIVCQDLTTTITRLSQNPQDRLQKLCLSEFMYDTYLDNYLGDGDLDYYQPDEAKKTYQYPYLGNIPSRFAGNTLNRLDIYQSTFASGQKDELSAYALHRAIGCFASSGNNQCSNQDIPIATRKGWFNRLKSDFANANWAKNQKYYW